MKNYKPAIFAASMSTLLLVGCIFGKPKSGLRSETGASTIPAISGYVADLGSGYDPDHGRIIPSKCIVGTIGSTAPFKQLSAADAQFQTDTDSNYILSKLGGGLEGSFPVFPGINAGAHLQFATENSSNVGAYSISMAQSVSRTTSLVEQYWAGADFKRAAATAPANDKTARRAAEIARCGTEFVQTIHTGASIVATITFQFDSISSKSKYQADFLMDLLGGVGTLKTGGSVTGHSLSESFTVKLAVSQLGGRPEYLTQLFPDGLPNCRWQPSIADDPEHSWLKACRTAKDILVGYVTGAIPSDNTEAATALQRAPSFPAQLAESSNEAAFSPYVPISYRTRAFEESDWRHLEDDGFIPVSGNSLSLTGLQGNESLQALLKESVKIQSQEQLFRSYLKYPLSRTVSVNDAADPNKLDDSTFRLLYQTANIQLSRILRYKSALIAQEQYCWQNPRACKANDMQLKIRDLQVQFPINTDFLFLKSDQMGFNAWCMAASKGLIAQSDLDTVNALLETANTTGLNSASNPAEWTSLCANAANYLQSTSQLTINVAHTSSDGLTSLRALDNLTFATSLRDLSARRQNLGDFPVFTALINLKNLDLAHSIIDIAKANPGKLRDLPQSLASIDLTCVGMYGGADNNKWLSEQILANLNVPRIIMRGHSVSALRLQPNVRELYLDDATISPSQLLDLSLNRSSPLHIYLVNPSQVTKPRSQSNKKQQSSTQEQNVVISVDPNPITCN